MEIVQEDNGKKGRFFISGPSGTLAEIVYNWVDPANIIIEHTEVDSSLKGLGIGNKLVDAVVVWAREQGLHILPLCSFAKKVFERKPDYGDVLFRK